MYARKGKNGTYYLEARIGSDITGKYQKVYKTVHDIKGKRDLKKAIDLFQREIDDGLVTRKKSKISLYDMCRKMLDEVIAMDVKPTTLTGYETIMKRVADYPISKAKAELIQTGDMQTFVAQLRDHPYSAKTIRATMSFLSTCYDSAIRCDLMSHNPCVGIRLPKKDKNTARALNLDELPVFLMHLDELHPDIKVAFELALFLGLRRSEICGLKWEHIHDDYISIEETRHTVLVDGKWKDSVSDTKTTGSEAFVAIPGFLRDDLTNLKKYHEEMKEYEGYYSPNEEYVILSTTGSKIDPNALYKQLQRYIKKTGISHVTFHQLRHTYASLVNYLGADIVELASQMRHANANITLSTYTHMVRSVSDSSKKYAEEMEKLHDEIVN